jgi:AcrR family transcriptional regulator
MPTPVRTSLDEIVAAGRDILEAEGPDRLTMQAVAERVGVRAPSLYKRVDNRDALVRLIAEAAVTELGERLDSVVSQGGVHAGSAVGELARDLRAFAHANPAAYRLIFSGTDATRPDPALLARASAPLLRVTADLAGPADALEAARTVTAWANGFISMELAGAFQLGGDLERAFDFGIARLTDAISGTRTHQSRDTSNG